MTSPAVLAIALDNAQGALSTQSSSSSSVARNRPVCESTATFVVWPFFEPIASRYLRGAPGHAARLDMLILRVSQRSTTEEFLKILSGSCCRNEQHLNAGGTLEQEHTVRIPIFEDESREGLETKHYQVSIAILIRLRLLP
ncbi:hypothetical protein [Bradyrhizobium sp. STM 3562]|uniref:hypothetical protein n=1 Tax=Bradyrhizobium sp. STM 3562 TaxID=578924 RepID=UPI00388DCAE6